jgi:two-component system, OmpR family, sensor histidine kinase CiaH
MQKRSRSILIFTILFGYIILQFLWWEVLLVRQTTQLSNEQQKLTEITSTDPALLKQQLNELQHKKQMRIYMIAGEGTVFLLLLLFGIYKIRQAYERETELMQQQKNFLLSVTHELKTPIAASKLQLQTLLKHQLDPEKQKQLLNSALNETNRLNRLIEDVLLANQAENNNLKIHPENTNVSELVTQTVYNYFSDKISAGAIRLAIEENVFGNVDKLFFPSILINLIENAVKYSFDEPKIDVGLTRQNGQVILRVADYGSGIPAKEKEKIFQKFYRVGNEDTRTTKGTGLGLYIVKKIADAHGAKIDVSDNIPKGSVFKISL